MTQVYPTNLHVTLYLVFTGHFSQLTLALLQGVFISNNLLEISKDSVGETKLCWLYYARSTPDAPCCVAHFEHARHGAAQLIWVVFCTAPHKHTACQRTRSKFCWYIKRKLVCWNIQFGQGFARYTGQPAWPNV